MSLELFHPAVSHWFTSTFGQASDVQAQAWPSIKDNHNTLIAAPTGSGKTLAAFLAVIDTLIQLGSKNQLPNHTVILYISPLKALSNDIEKNLQHPLNGIRDVLLEMGQDDITITAALRTGDTSASQRAKINRQPPHIIVTTPESFYLLLTSVSGRNLLATIQTVIIDEIHALAGNKRGSHVTLSLQRLDALCLEFQGTRTTRIGISATQKPIDLMANFLVSKQPCNIIDTGFVRQRDLELVLTQSPLDGIMSNEVWEEIYDQIQEFSKHHRTCLVFVNTRRLAERAAHHLSERIGEDNVTAHHGSLSREHRLQAENKLKNGELKILFATASLELGIDIGDIDIVVQLGSPRSIATFLQRIGRSGHSLDAIPKGRLFPLTRDDLVECSALLHAINQHELDKIIIPAQPLDVLAQQIVAEIANKDWSEKDLYQCFTQALPYQDLSIQTFNNLLKMLSEGFSTRRGRRSAYIHRDIVNGKLYARRSARIVSLTNAGAIPDQFDYSVLLQPCGSIIGSLNEDFAFESIPGDIFQLGNSSYRMLKIEQGKVFVEDAHGQAPNIPFWFGEAPGRTDELSFAVSRLRGFVNKNLQTSTKQTIINLIQTYKISANAAQQLTDYLSDAFKVFGNQLPTQKNIIFERFFDETGDLHLVIHSPFGSRINRAWGLSLRKRFCRKFNFELQAAATDDNIVLSLGPTHSFPLEEVQYYLKSETVQEILIQALLDAPMFATQWRWNCNISLAVPRNRNGKRVPAQFQRNNAEDLIAIIFPDQLACLENISGHREIPEHPLVQQTIVDCIHQRMDITGLCKVLKDIQETKINISCCDLPTPSSLATEIINARNYAFLDDAPAEERRTLAIQRRAAADPNHADQIGSLNRSAILRVQLEAWPNPRDAEELHDALLVLGFMTEYECTIAANHFESSVKIPMLDFFNQLISENRATRVTLSGDTPFTLWVAAERLQEILSLYQNLEYHPNIKIISNPEIDSNNPEQNLIGIIRSRLEGLGPITAKQLALTMQLEEPKIYQALLILEQQGFVIRGNFSSKSIEQWCQRALLARIHRYTLKQLRAEIEPVNASQFMTFLFHWQRISDPLEGKQALAFIINQLEGISVAAKAWEQSILPARLADYSAHWLDQLSISGFLTWLRLTTNRSQLTSTRFSSPLVSTAINLIPRDHLQFWLHPTSSENHTTRSLNAQLCYTILKSNGALFFNDIVNKSGLLKTEVENILGELVFRGDITSDNFSGLRSLITPTKRKPSFTSRRMKMLLSHNSVADAGRWSIIKTDTNSDKSTQIQHIAEILLLRYGIVFRKILDRENNLPSWGELLYCYNRMEAKGEIRGGRFVAGFSGQQFALKEALSSLRQLRKMDSQQKKIIVLSAADPLNLTGIITPGERVPALQKNRIIYENGIPIAYSVKDEVKFIKNIVAAKKEKIMNAILNIKNNNIANKILNNSTINSDARNNLEDKIK